MADKPIRYYPFIHFPAFELRALLTSAMKKTISGTAWESPNIVTNPTEGDIGYSYISYLLLNFPTKISVFCAESVKPENRRMGKHPGPNEAKPPAFHMKISTPADNNVIYTPQDLWSPLKRPDYDQHHPLWDRCRGGDVGATSWLTSA